MPPPGPFLVVAALPVVLAGLARWPRVAVVLAALGCVVPFGVPQDFPRTALALVTWVLLYKAVQLAAGEVRPRGFLDRLQLFTTVAVVHWESPRQPDVPRAVRTLATGLAQLGVAAALVVLVLWLDLRNPIEIVTTELGIYVSLAGANNLAVVGLALRGLAYEDPFDNPLAARTPAEFWGRRWNTWVNDQLYRHVFVPAGGRRHVVRGTLAAFAVSALLHEAMMLVSGHARGGMLAFFMLQGVMVVATSRSRPFRRFSARFPFLSWLFTLSWMMVSGVLLVWGMAGLDPSHAWERCCAGR